MNSIVVHYKELALKGRNRPWFIGQLVRHLRAALKDLPVRSVRAVMGRIEIRLEDEGAWPAAAERVGRVFGIANYSFAGWTTHDLDQIASVVLADLGDRQPASFRVSVRRSDKRVPLTSPELEREIGGRIKLAKGWRVDLSHPDLTIHVEMLADGSFYYFGKEPGAGGMPTGTGGRVACLLSGGIDSPVAAYRMMRRGCRVDLIHFHSYPILSHASQDKVREIAALLARYQLRVRLALVPFGGLQQQVVLSVPPELRVVIYRRLMLRIAGAMAGAWKARALVTGEAIGQVASQTLENMTLIAEASPLEVLRPLVGYDKDEISAEAERIGTYAVSIIPDQDCCTLFTPKHPATRARQADVERAEAALDLDAMAAEAAGAAVVEVLGFPVIRSSVGHEPRRSTA